MIYAFIHTLKFITLIAFLVLAFLFFSPLRVDAYYTTAQNAVKIDDDTALYFIDFVFGSEKREVYVPSTALNTTEKLNDTISYSIIDNDGKRVTSGSYTSIVVAKTNKSGAGMYVTPTNVGVKFTLAVLFKEEPSDVLKRYRLEVNNLPYMFDGVQQLQLNDTQLEAYRTKFITL